jgi:peptidyl-dipeptidase Dcp
MYRNFTGHDPEIQPYLNYYGLTGTASPAPAAPMPAAAVPAEQPQPQKGERGL